MLKDKKNQLIIRKLVTM